MCWYLARGGRGGRDHKTHRASAFPATFLFLRLSHGGFHTSGVPRSVRGVTLTLPPPSVLYFTGGELKALPNRATLQEIKSALASVSYHICRVARERFSQLF